ncbi:MAG: methylenetetrahydrofolate reductase C-terminal domain-containing protein [Candidatus Dormibacteraeota bacterium]|nr:methylenetetrahydrofolate reductase C-terminal domain-containing protein [Candidatus Dormibacteraeota bacterium]
MPTLEQVVIAVEKPLKEAVWGCKMCGQCILHSTGLSCPMRCPKNLRNGPCGGVRADGNCEVYPDRACVWVEAWERSRQIPLYRDHIHRLEKPVDWRLQGTSSWINLLTGRDRHAPAGWDAHDGDQHA